MTMTLVGCLAAVGMPGILAPVPAYPQDLEKAAVRHLAAADRLFDDKPDHPDVAGYLYGIAAELAVKAIMLRELPSRGRAPHAEDPFYAHYPHIRTLVRDSTWGRHAKCLTEFIANEFLSNWDIGMRYAAGADVRKQPIARWKQQAHRAVQKMRE